MAPEIWSFLETEDGGFHDTAGKMAAESRRTAKIFNAEACAVVCGQTTPGTLDQLKWYGLKKLYIFQGEPTLSPEVTARSIQAAALKGDPLFLLFADTPVGAEVAARTAASLPGGLISGCTDFECEGGKPVAVKAVFKGKIHERFGWTGRPPYLATVDLSALEDVREKTRTEPDVVYEELARGEPLAKLIKKWEVSLSDLDLGEARMVIGVGRGVDAGFMKTIEKLAELTRGVIGGSRIAVYSGLVPLDRQIGTTGKWINSDIYLTVGISGAPQHVMGIKGVKKLISIDRSKQAPILKYARLGVIGDLYEVVPKLISLLETNAKKEP